MPAAKKFMFETVFEDATVPQSVPLQVQEGLEEEEVEPEEVVPTFSAEELEAARKEGFQAGKEEGLNASLDSIERQVSATLGNMEGAINQLVEKQHDANEELSHLALSVAISISRKMFPELASRHALDEIERVLNSVLPRLIDEPVITLRIHSDVEADINSRIEPLRASSGYTGLFVVKPDQDLEIGDCRLEWSCGGAERNSTALWRDIDAIIARNFDKALVTPPEDITPPEELEDIAQSPDEAMPDLPSPEPEQTPGSGEPEEAQPEELKDVSGAPATSDEIISTSEQQEDELETKSPDSVDITDVATDPDLPPTTDT